MRISFGADIQDMRPRINHFLINKMDCAVGEKQQINKDVGRCNLQRARFFQRLLLLYLNISISGERLRNAMFQYPL